MLSSGKENKTISRIHLVYVLVQFSKLSSSEPKIHLGQ